MEINRQAILAKIDHTLLKSDATWLQIAALCQEAQQHQTAAACLPPCYVARAREHFPTLNLCTVIAFPLGYQTTATKLAEAEVALADGADELDLVINLGWVKEGRYEAVQAEIAAVKDLCGKRLLKVIVETCLLSQEEKIALCQVVSDSGADFIKTSTGFGAQGAQVDDIRLFQHHLTAGVKIKAAGGIRTLTELLTFYELGCDRIGASNAVRLLREDGV